jgi:hypothetical protein
MNDEREMVKNLSFALHCRSDKKYVSFNKAEHIASFVSGVSL